MALVKLDPSSKKPLCDVSTSDDVQTMNATIPNNFSNSNTFSQFYCKRVIVQECKVDEPPITRIEESVFRCHPDQTVHSPYNQYSGQPYEQFFQQDNFINQSHRRKKSSHSSKHRSHHKCSLKKNGKSHHKHDKDIKPLYMKAAAAGIFGCLFLAWWLSTLYWCQTKSLDFLSLESALKYDIIGQEDALNSLLLNFYRAFNLNTQPPVFLLSGSTGVGKSFIIDRILNSFPGSGHKESLFYPTPAPEAVVKKLKSCEHNLLVIDGLFFKDSYEIASWVERIQKEAAIQSKTLWLLLGFTTEHWISDTTAASGAEFLQEISKISNKIEEVLNRRGIATQLITFKPMDVHNVKECVRKELENLSLRADETQLNEIVRELTSTPTLRLKGCKHVKKYFLHSSNTIGLTKAVN